MNFKDFGLVNLYKRMDLSKNCLIRNNSVDILHNKIFEFFSLLSFFEYHDIIIDDLSLSICLFFI